jgi:hypothetical protein
LTMPWCGTGVAYGACHRSADLIEVNSKALG